MYICFVWIMNICSLFSIFLNIYTNFQPGNTGVMWKVQGLINSDITHDSKQHLDMLFWQVKISLTGTETTNWTVNFKQIFNVLSLMDNISSFCDFSSSYFLYTCIIIVFSLIWSTAWLRYVVIYCVPLYSSFTRVLACTES